MSLATRIVKDSRILLAATTAEQFARSIVGLRGVKKDALLVFAVSQAVGHAYPGRQKAAVLRRLAAGMLAFADKTDGGVK